MKFLNGKKNSYIFNETKGNVVGKFVNGVFDTDDEEIIVFLKGKYKTDGVIDVDFTEVEPVVEEPILVDKDDEEELPEIKEEVKEKIIPSTVNIKKMNQGQLKLEMNKYGLVFKIGMKNDDIKAMILKARKEQ